jgi:hypothetical protein
MVRQFWPFATTENAEKQTHNGNIADTRTSIHLTHRSRRRQESGIKLEK